MPEHTQHQQELFAQVGNRLRSAREERGYTLQELSAHTRINQTFLQKIEAGDLSGLPGLAFVKGFIRNYIQVLQLDDPELNEALQRLNPEPTPQAVAEQIRSSSTSVLDVEVPSISWVKMGLFVVVAALVLWVAWVLFQGTDEPEPVARREAPTGGLPEALPSGPPAQAGAGDTDGAARGEGPSTEAPGTAPAAAAPGTGPAAPPAPGAGGTGESAGAPPGPGGSDSGAARSAGPVEGRQKLELTVRGLEPTWVRLSIDRAPPIDVRMQPAETVTWEANQEIRLTIGKSHGVAVYLNGEEILLPQEPDRLIPNLVLNKLTLLRLEN